jgi:hypothetical protein
VTTIAKVTQARPDIDTDGFPLFPPLTGGRDVPITARSLPRLVAGLTTGVLTARTENVVAAVVFVDRQPVDGMALRSGRRVTGPDALDEIADVPIERLSFSELPPDLAAALGSYFLPTEVREVPAARVLPEAFVRSLARPDGRGCVLVRAGHETGLVFLAAGRVLLALRPAVGRIGGMEAVADLLADPEARLWARLGTLPEDPSLPGQVAVPPVARPVPAPLDQALDLILEEARRRLGRHSAAVEDVFRRAPLTDEGLRSAAEAVRGVRIRLVSAVTLEEIADDAIAILSRLP